MFNEVCERSIPRVPTTGAVKTCPKWMTRGIKSKMRRKLNIWHVNQRERWRDPRSSNEYKVLKAECTSEVTEAVKRFEKGIANNAKKNPKMLYS